MPEGVLQICELVVISEIGRTCNKKIPAESGFCQIRKSGKVENKMHVITKCLAFTNERNMLFNDKF